MSFTLKKWIQKEKWLMVCVTMLLFPIVLRGNNSDDTATFIVYFGDGMSVVDENFEDNRAVLDSVAAYVRGLSSHGIAVTFELAGSTSPNGLYDLNQRLALKRARNLKNYIVRRLAVEESTAKIASRGIDYAKLRDLVASDNGMPGREHVLNILDSVPEVRMSGGRVVEQKKRRLLWLDNGKPYYYMKARMFADLRCVEIALPAMPGVTVGEEPKDTVPTAKPVPEKVADPLPDSAPEIVADSLPKPVPEPATVPLQLSDTIRLQHVSAQETPKRDEVPVVDDQFVERMALKTNMIYDALLAPDIELEYRINDRWSVAIEGTMAWWHNDGRHRYYQLAVISPEVRYWFKTKKPWHGHYVGLFGGQGWYDLENGERGYRGEGQMAALSYGYMFPVSRHLSFDAEVGVGYMHTRFQEYLPVDGHYVYQQTSKINYFGPVRLKFSLVWRFWSDKREGGVKYDY